MRIVSLTLAAAIACAGVAPAMAAQGPIVQDSALLAPRLVPVSGAQNFRDIGGYRTRDGRRVKWGLIYRSAELSHLTPADLNTIGALGIHTIHDLRAVSERTKEPTAWTGPEAPRVVVQDYELDLSTMAGFFGGPITADRAREAFLALYPALLESQMPQERALFTGLLEADGGTLYHCTAGKDRTGLATAMILSALGVPRDTILYDYELSNRYFAQPIDSGGGADGSGVGPAGLPPEVGAVFMQVDRRYLATVLDQIDLRYGSIEVYLDQELGVDAVSLERLRTLYTE